MTTKSHAGEVLRPLCLDLWKEAVGVIFMAVLQDVCVTVAGEGENKMNRQRQRNSVREIA